MTPTGRDGWRHGPAAAGVVFAAALVLLVGGRLHLPLLEPEEALYAVIPRDMLAADSVVVPVLRGEPYLDKPPLLYWAVTGCYRAFGAHVWSARLVPAVAAWLTVVAVFAWGRAVGGRGAGLAAAAVLTLTGDFVYRGPMLTPNGLLGLFTTAALGCGHVAVRGDRVRAGWWAASAGCTGLAVLTKGPVALVLVAAPLFALPRLTGGLARPGAGACAAYLGGVVLVAAPWFVAVTARHPEFPEYFFWKHHVRRYTDPFDHAKPPYFYLPQLLLGGLPWTLVPLAAVVELVRRRPADATPPAARFARLAAAAGFLFFSLSGSKRAVYLVPLWPVFAVGIGATLAAPAARIAGLSRRGWLAAGGVVGVILVAGVFAWLPEYHRRFGVADAARAVADRGPGVTVFAYPQGWNSLDFLRGDAVPVYQEGDAAKLVEALRTHDRSVVVVKSGPAYSELVAALPADLEVTGRQVGWLVTLVDIERRDRAAPAAGE